MGHIVFLLLHFAAFFLGGVGLFVTIPLHIIYCAASKPKTLREDGKKRNDGLFGSVIDDIVISYKMKDCPYCQKKIMKDALKCPYCQSSLTEDVLFNELKTCPFCAEKIKKEAKICRFCNREIPIDDSNTMKTLSIEEFKRQGIRVSKCEICGRDFLSSDIQIYNRKTVCSDCYDRVKGK